MEIDTDYTVEPICPYCGKVYSDAWELDLGGGIEGDGEISCGSCNAYFLVARHCSVTYSTRKLNEKK